MVFTRRKKLIIERRYSILEQQLRRLDEEKREEFRTLATGMDIFKAYFLTVSAVDRPIPGLNHLFLQLIKDGEIHT